MSETMYIDPEAREIFESFIAETQELLDTISKDLMLLEAGTGDSEILNRVFRSFHTIKGTASFMGFTELITIIHSAEDLLNTLRKTEIGVSPEVIDVLLEVHDWVAVLVHNPGTPFQSEIGTTMEKIAALVHSRSAAESLKTEDTEPVTLTPLEDFIRNAPVDSADFTSEELRKLDAAFAEINKSFKNPPYPATGHTQSGFDTAAGPGLLNDATIRVDVHRIEQLADLSAELVLERNRLEQLMEELKEQSGGNELTGELLKTSEQISRITSGLQSSVTKIRMTSVEKLYQKAPRIIRDLSREFNKEIRLVLKGEKTDVDRTILEELADPLVHMLRNACDHGIESPEERERQGKARFGTITLDTAYQGNRVVLRIEDDGAGLDTEKLKKRAIENRLITSELAGEMPSDEIFQLIFAPGFSTVDAVSNVSGRGVGMDVVCTNVGRLRGSITIESAAGKGTAFIISLPSVTSF